MKTKTFLSLILGIGSLFSISSLAQAQIGESQDRDAKSYQRQILDKTLPDLRRVPAPATRPDRSLRIHAIPEPHFPISMSDKTRRGHVRVLLEVGADGKLTDYLLIAYSRKAFAKSVEDVIGKWTFEPALYQGEPIGVVTEVNIDFDVGGVVINTDFMEIVDNFLHSYRKDLPEYAPANLRQIDRIPEPIKVVNPQYRVGMGVVGEVTIQFYINEQGKVRMPHVMKADDLRLADLAMEAIRGWEFSPPTYRGAPVLVKANQVFKFSDKKPAAPKAPAANP